MQEMVTLCSEVVYLAGFTIFLMLSLLVVSLLWDGEAL